MVKFNGINHLAMATGDMDRTIAYWRDLIGFRLVAGLGQPGYRHYFFEISPTDLLAFFEWPGVESVRERDHGYPSSGPVVFDHISFGVDTADDLYELKARLEAAGYNVSGVIDHGFIWSIYSWDPNGIPVEFSYSLPEVDVRAKPQMKDRSPTSLAREGAEPVLSRRPRAETPPPESRRVYPGAGSELFHGAREE